jgi:hypothetical protein
MDTAKAKAAAGVKILSDLGTVFLKPPDFRGRGKRNFLLDNPTFV